MLFAITNSNKMFFWWIVSIGYIWKLLENYGRIAKQYKGDNKNQLQFVAQVNFSGPKIYFSKLW